MDQTYTVRTKTVKLLVENKGKTLHDTRFANDFLNMKPKVKTMKVKIDKCEPIKITNLCVSQ